MQPANQLSIESLSEGWCDKDHIILHACFQILNDFVEKEMQLNPFPDWNADEKIRVAKQEIGELYDWWQVKKKEDPFGADAASEEEHEKENEMLKRLVGIRKYLWT